MTIVNQHATPPGPNAPPVHFLPTWPGEGPRIIHHSTRGPVSPTRLAAQLGQLQVGSERCHTGNGQGAKSAAPTPRDLSVFAPLYEGYTFSKADATPGHKSTWARAERIQLSLSQNALFKMARREAKKISISEQYQSLSKVKRTLVDQLTDEQKRSDPRFEWHCVYAKEKKRPFKGKNSRHGDYETVSMDIVTLRRPISAFDPDMPRDAVDIEGPVVEKGSQPINTYLRNNVQWAKPNTHQQDSVMINYVPQLYSPQLLGPQPRPGAGAGPYPSPHPVQRHSNGGGQSVRDWLWPQLKVGAQQSSGMSGVPGASWAYPNYHTAAEISNGSGQVALTNPDVFRSGQMSTYGHPGIPSDDDDDDDEGFASLGHGPPEKRNSSPVGFGEDHITPIPNLKIEPELEWPPELSDTDDSMPSGKNYLTEDLADESIAYDYWEEEEEEEEILDSSQKFRRSQPFRGSLFRRNSPTRLNRRGPLDVYPLRDHYRKPPNRSNENSVSGQSNRGRCVTCSMEMVPETSSTNSDREMAELPSREVTVQGSRDRSTIVHDPETSSVGSGAELHPDGRLLRHDIRTRILNDREARLKHREEVLRLNEAQYLNLCKRLEELLMHRYSRRSPLPEESY